MWSSATKRIRAHHPLRVVLATPPTSSHRRVFNSPHDQTGKPPDQAPSGPDLDDDTLANVRELWEQEDPFATHDDAGSEEPDQAMTVTDEFFFDEHALDPFTNDENPSTPSAQGGVGYAFGDQRPSYVQQPPCSDQRASRSGAEPWFR